MSTGEAVSGVFRHIFGVPAATVSSDEHVGEWRFGGAFDATQRAETPAPIHATP